MKLHELLAGSEVVDRCEDCLGLKEYGSGIRVCRVCRVQGQGLRHQGVGCRPLSFMIQIYGLGLGLGFQAQGSDIIRVISLSCGGDVHGISGGKT